ncbi:RHOMBOID-like protein 8 [Ricinus communis]|uniref:RHOMBOID-like protein n=1 Tax=Ricinus communis TaxID=3988 RepID=B9RJC9_RICCO|nr:RHOMBOID-like protein 8 [Ricinus communis]EEF48431.1 KOM, putative [Ricinus communis]|eukprot:XP_002513848.1 RHOMBOID-like protein 8 [Ricinus communis]
MEVETPKLDSKIEINLSDNNKNINQTFSSFSDFADSLQDPNKTPFFKSRRRRDTWLISIFVIIHLGAFIATMIVNDCSTNSYGDCAIKTLGRLSFQPLSENPLLGPSASTLDKMGALRRTLVIEHQTWRLFSCPWLHAGLIHLIIDLIGVIFLGIYLEQEFGPLRVGIIYILSAFFGSLVTALFVRDSPVVSSSGAQLGLLGATFSALVRNWKSHTNKVAAVLIHFFVFACNVMLGLLPYADNYSNIGGLISGFLLGFVLLYTPQLRKLAPKKSGLYDDGLKSVLNLKQKLDRPVLRTVSLLLFSVLLVGFLVAALQGINISHYCKWCGYFDCIPSKSWSCNDVTTSCEIMSSDAELTLTCMSNGNFKVLPFANMSEARTRDLCTLICF